MSSLPFFMALLQPPLIGEEVVEEVPSWSTSEPLTGSEVRRQAFTQTSCWYPGSGASLTALSPKGPHWGREGTVAEIQGREFDLAHPVFSTVCLCPLGVYPRYLWSARRYQERAE